ncbi:MAG: amidohydrolase family protein [Coriobacteriales bacterium]|nr:amidohydrolase family protein [Coriobacteriales bacterium]
MKVDKIYKNANVFTSAARNFHASAFAVKDGKFVFVGDEAGLVDYEGDVVDLGGRFVMPGIIDSHIHIAINTILEYTPELVPIVGDGKPEILDFIRSFIAENPGRSIYKFVLGFYFLHGEKLTCWDLDKITTDAQIVIMESVGHSGWVNSKVLHDLNVSDDIEDISPGLSRYDRDQQGRLTGFATEAAFQEFNCGHMKDITDEQIRVAIKRFFDYCVKMGISCVFEAGSPEGLHYHDRIMQILCDMDEEGLVPINIESSYMIMDPRSIDSCIDVLKDMDKKYHTQHVRCRIMKMMMDGIESGRSAALIDPYDDGTCGGRLTDEITLSKLLVNLNKEGIDFHVHTVGELAVKTVLDAVELAQKEIGGKLLINVTCAHLGVVRDEDILRFQTLDVIANYTPLWHGGTSIPGGVAAAVELFGDVRGRNLNKSGMMWRNGTMVTFSSDNISFGDFSSWSPFQGMEVGISRKDVTLSPVPGDYSQAEFYPPASECMTIEQMLIGYTINGAKQLHLELTKGSIEVGKDADYIILKENLLKIPAQGMMNIVPEQVFFKGVKVN